MMILQQTRGALSSGDQLALDLPFAETKSLTARLGPTPVFTRASSGTFVGSNGLIQSAGNNVARFDHDPITGICRGLLIEDSRTNLLLRSELLTNTTSWSNYQITGSATSAPDGNNTATSFTENTVTDAHINQGGFGNNRPTPGAVSCTFSLFIKAGTRRYVILSATAGSNGVGMIVDTQTWTVTEAKSLGTGWSYTSNRLTDYGNGWYRAELTFTPPAATAVICGFGGSLLSTFSSSAPAYLGNSSTFIAWGAQLEAGSFASSYIPTTTASVVRSADVCSITGAAFTSFCNQTEGTLSLKSTILGATYAGAVVLAAPDRFNCSVIIARISSTVISSAVRSNYGIQANFNSTNITSGSENRTIIAFEQNNFAASTNGSTVLTDTIGEFATNIYPLTQMHIGSDIGTRMFGWISEVKYYRRRLPNAKLQALTAP